MGLVIRQFTYVPGQVIVAAQNNTNEDTLYSLVNGNLTGDNFAAIEEAKINYDTVAGHNHDGANSRKIDITGAGFLLRATTTATDDAIKGVSQVATKAGISGVGTAASSYGGYFNSTISSGLGALVENTGGGIALQVQNAASASDHACSFVNRSTTANKAAISIANTGSQATSASILMNTISTGYGLFITNTAAGTPIRIERSTITASSLIDARMTGGGNNLTTGIFLDHNGDGSSQGRAVEVLTDGAEGIKVTNSASATGSTSLAMTLVGGDGGGANAQPVASILANKTGSSGDGGGLFVQNTADAPVGKFLGTITATGGTVSTNNWVLVVRNASAGATKNSLYVEGFTRMNGDVTVSGTLSAGTVLEGAVKPFKIDHPIDPINKVLRHIAVESPEMKTFYDGITELDKFGFGEVNLPGYFLALNKDFRYQVTALGTGNECPRVASEVDSFGRFIIRGDPNGFVSWLVTGVRKDKFAEKYRDSIPVESSKETPGYIHPECFV